MYNGGKLNKIFTFIRISAIISANCGHFFSVLIKIDYHY